MSVQALCADMFAEECMVIALAAVVESGIVVRALYTLDLGTGATISALKGKAADVAPGIGLDVFAGANANTCAATMTALESILILTSSEEALTFG